MLARRFFPAGLASLLVAGAVDCASAQTAYFVDGFHGGVWGHYPTNYTEYIVQALREHPNWKINLEIEPETWDAACTNTPKAYEEFKDIVRDQSRGGRVEFINPDYAQSYLWDIEGESMVQQFARGMRKIREHFPEAQFKTYSSEEPCFTSALPGILTGFGIENAVLKNPNTCWGGYTRAFGGELVNWVGPDGTVIRTVPRYGIESLKAGSTWETIGNANSVEYIEAARRAGIQHPVGMCIQDAGWRFGPWLGTVGKHYEPSEYTLWRNYFENVASPKGALDWRFSQEDVLVSLVWGSQVLQHIAQEVRTAENRVVMAEKMATLAGVYDHMSWPGPSLEEGWRTLLLSQHHDCWIVPYNGRPHDTWADKVVAWTGNTRQRSDAAISDSMAALNGGVGDGGAPIIRVFNTLGKSRNELVEVALPEGWRSDSLKLIDAAGTMVPVQPAGAQAVLFRASAPSLGFSTYRLKKDSALSRPDSAPASEANGLLTVETDCYKITFDRTQGGTIKSLVAKKLGQRELVETGNARRFNEIRGYFSKQGQFLSNTGQPAKVELLENGPLRYRVKVSSEVGSNAVTQMVTLVQGEPRIDCSVRIDWQGNPAIGAKFAKTDRKREDDRKEFYDDRYKLLATFPLDLPGQKIFKDAPFDVTESKLTDTFFQNWSAIKNNIILNWVDAYDKHRDVGVCLLTDHTTSYTHDTNDTVGLTLAYSGGGLWGRDYTITGPTEVHYALLPHAGNWQKSGLWNMAKSWNEPLLAKVFQSEGGQAKPSQSLLRVEVDAWEIPTARLNDGKVWVRLFNPSAKASKRTLHYGGAVSKVELVRLDGQVLREIPFKQSQGEATFKLALPQLGVGTLRITP